MYPHRMLSSHFLTSEQKTELQKAATSARAANLSSLLSTDGYSEELRHLETSLNNVSLQQQKFTRIVYNPSVFISLCKDTLA